MTQIDLRYTVQGSIVSTDTGLLDTIASALPAEGTVVLGDEYSINRVSDSPDLGANEERLSARMTFAPDGDAFADDSNGVPKLVVDEGSDTDADGNPVPAEHEVLRSNVSDAEMYGPKQAALGLFNAVANHDLATKASGWDLQVYRSPQGGVRASDVQAWYEADETRQPTRTDEDGNEESYVPSGWQPEHHIVASESG